MEQPEMKIFHYDNKQKRRVLQEISNTISIHRHNKPINQQKSQSVKLQKYTITQFEGDCKGLLRFWNQFEGEVDIKELGSSKN